MANKAIVYAIYPDKEQDVQCQKTFGCCRLVYNTMFDLQQERYKNGEKHLSKKKANNYCNQVLKKEKPFLKETDKFALTNSIYHLEDAYTRFFNHIGGFPKFKCKHKSKKSYTTNFTNNNIELGDNHIKLPKLGKVKAVIHRRPDESWKIKSVTVTQHKDGKYQVSVLFKYEEAEVKSVINEDTAIGLDYKSDGLYVDSNGNCCDMPHFYRKSARKLAREQRRLSRKNKDSNNYQKQKKKVAKIHRHVANQRKDYLQKESTAIAKQYSCVCVENLNMRAMANKGFGNGKATLDNGYGMFLNMLEYKLEENGGRLVKVDKYYASSQICHYCGNRNPKIKDLSIRKWDCPHCGKKNIDRDYNAALNIKKEGLRLLTAV